MKWNLKEFYNSFDEWDKDYSVLKEKILALKKYEGKLGTKEGFKNYLNSEREAIHILYNVYQYASLSFDLNMKDEFVAGKAQSARMLFAIFQQSTSWFRPEVISLGKDKVMSFIDSDSSLEEYRFPFENLFHSQEHVLSKEVEEIMANFSSISSQGELYSALAVADGKDLVAHLSTGDVTVTGGNWRSLIADSKDPLDREKIFEAAFAKYKNNKNTFAAIYNNVLKANWANAKSRKYETCLDSFLFDNNIPKSVFTSLMKVCKENTEGIKRYYNIRKKYFGLDVHHTYDRFLSFAESNVKYTYDEAKNIFFKSIENMPNDFINKAHQALEDGYVDVLEQPGKKTGAYSSGVYGHHPYILLNFDNTQDAVFTLAHEAGHSIHTMFANEAQKEATADYQIFVAEIASTFNEHNLLDYLVKNAKTKNEKIALLEQAIDDIMSTFFRQTLFATYEYEAHKLVEEGKPITASSLSQIMVDLYKSYYDIDITKEDGKEFVWAYIPHLTYTPFYVYQYATSFSASLKIYENIKNNVSGAMDNYINMLKAGGKTYPVDVVKIAGVDLTTEEPFMAVVRRLNTLLDELEEALK